MKVSTSRFKVVSALVCLGIFLVFSFLPATLIMFDAGSQIKVAFTITEEERKCSLDEKSIVDISLALSNLGYEDDQGIRSGADLDDERWILKPIYYDVISPPPEVSASLS